MSQTLKYLGVIFDQKLWWGEHVKYIGQKSWQFVNVLARVAKMDWGLGSEALRVIYIGVFRPLILYTVTVWYSALNSKKNKIKIK